MREIKFRAWGINSKEFLSPDGKVFGLTLKEIQNIEDISLWEFQQFIGLKDKNGKEIYEGDVIKYNSIGNTYTDNGQIIYNNNKAMFVIYEENKKDKELYNDVFGKVEVIGNIFENPELINL